MSRFWRTIDICLLGTSRPFQLPLLLLLFFGLNTALFAQNVRITGSVEDAETGEPLPFANVFIEGKFIGTNTDMDGTYKLDVNKRTDSLTVTVLGYTTQRKAVGADNPQVIDFLMVKEDYALGEVVVVAGESPSETMMKKVIKAKPINNYTKLDRLQYEAYTKYEIDLENFTQESLEDNKLLSRFPHLKDYVDTVSETGNSLLPVFLIENLSDNYQENNPYRVREVMKGIKMSGIQKQDFITELLGNVNQNLNIYENLLSVMGKSLISPLADYGLSVYKYNLNIYDTLFIGGEPHLEMTFKPKRKDDYAFKGKMLINIKTYGVHSIEMELNDDINIGLVKDLKFSEEFTKLSYKVSEDSVAYAYIPQKERLSIKFTYYFGGETRILGRKTKSIKDIKINEPLIDTAFSAYEATSITNDAYQQADTFWEAHRHDTLQKREVGIYDMVDSLKKTTRFKIILYTAQTLTSGFAKTGPVSIGPVPSIFSSNQVEKFRIRLGLRTNPQFSERVLLEAYGAYGFGDNRFKYGGGVSFIISRKPWNKISLYARTDVDFKSKYAEEFDQDNVFTIVNKRNTSQRFYNIEEYRISYDTELHKDLIFYLTVQHREITPFFYFRYMLDEVRREDVKSSEIDATFRWQFRSKPLSGTFNREAKAGRFFAQFRKKNEFPFIRAKYMAGIKGILGSDFTYHHIAGGLQGDYQITAKMSMYYNFWAGKIYGTVPFLLMRIPEGNFAFVHNKYFFNNMNMLEFAADEYMSLNFQYFFGGILLDKIPGIKKLKWREVITANVFWGNMSQQNREFNNYKSKNQYPVDIAYPIPYAEAGFGIENIFKIIRLDSIWRITHRDNRSVMNWSLYASLFIKI
ncbi:MAG: DUF5686 family protein [Chitinophagales bacterium]|nr:DUF5686 family protein [Chitinophagales bacterium]